jgi:type IV secretory pathway VirB4 component
MVESLATIASTVAMSTQTLESFNSKMEKGFEIQGNRIDHAEETLDQHRLHMEHTDKNVATLKKKFDKLQNEQAQLKALMNAAGILVPSTESMKFMKTKK